MNSWSVFEVVESNQNTRKTKKLIFPDCLFLSLSLKSTYGVVLFFGTILPSSFWSWDLKCRMTVIFSGWTQMSDQIYGSSLGWWCWHRKREESLRYKRPCKPQQTAMRCSDALPLCTTQTSPQKRHFSHSPICFETPWGSKYSDLKRAFVRRWSTILVLTYR